MRFFDVKSGAVTTRRIFDLEADPDETRSLGVEKDIFDALVARSASVQEPTFNSRFENLEPATLEQLRSLGYLE